MSTSPFSNLKRRMTRSRKNRSPSSSISSLSAVEGSILHISPPLTPPIDFGNDLDLALDSRFEPHRAAPTPPRKLPASVSNSPPVHPPRSPRTPELFAWSPPSRRAPPPPSPSLGRSSTETYSKAARRRSDESVGSDSSASSWRSQMVDVAMSYSTLTSANPRDFVATTTARAHHNVVLRRLSDPETTELEALAILRGYIDQVHSSSRGHPRRSSSDNFV